MTYDYADWDDENYGAGGTTVTLSLESSDARDSVTFVTQALDGAVRLDFTLAPEDTLDLLARVVMYSEVDVNECVRAITEAAAQRAAMPSHDDDDDDDDDAGDPDHERDLALDRELLA